MKHEYAAVLICAALLSSFGTVTAETADYAEKIEIVDSSINLDRQESPHAAYLRVTLKNNGGQRVSHLAFEIKYYDKDDYLIQKNTVKNKLDEDLAAGQTQKYKIRLKGDIVNPKYAQYPYSQANEVGWFDIDITKVWLSPK